MRNDTSPAARVRVATYNIHKCVGLDRRRKVSRIAEVLQEIRPDIVGLQEVLSIEGGLREENQARFLADELGMHLAMGDVRQLRGGLYGNIVLSKFPVRAFCRFDLSVPGREQRGCLRSDIALPDGEVLHLFNVHLGTDYFERRHQARLLLEHELIRSREHVGPRVVLGDFNEWKAGLVSQMLAAEFASADIRLHLRQKRTYPGVFPMMHLDHIYYDEDLIVERVALHKTLKALVASDHLPLYADFVLRARAEAEARDASGSNLDSDAGTGGATSRNTR
jgi:endonuclease/exonuclease/phosphatase family metal-dependent hydrolase